MSHKPIVTYAQNREDLILKSFFPDVRAGFYVDVGANHHTHDSVTKLFYETGWRGINIEPIPKLHADLQKYRSRDTNLAIGVSNQQGELKFVEFANGGLSTFSKRTSKEYKASHEVKATYDVKIDTLAHVFSDQAVERIHFLKIDIEGYEYEALEGNDWETYRPEVICIEANHIQKDWRPILEQANYRLVFFDGLNEYYLDEAASQREQLFRKEFPELLVAAPIIRYDWHQTIQKLEAQLEKVQAALDGTSELRNHVKAQERHLRGLEAERDLLRLELTDAQRQRSILRKIIDRLR